MAKHIDLPAIMIRTPLNEIRVFRNFRQFVKLEFSQKHQ